MAIRHPSAVRKRVKTSTPQWDQAPSAVSEPRRRARGREGTVSAVLRFGESPRPPGQRPRRQECSSARLESSLASILPASCRESSMISSLSHTTANSPHVLNPTSNNASQPSTTESAPQATPDAPDAPSPAPPPSAHVDARIRSPARCPSPPPDPAPPTEPAAEDPRERDVDVPVVAIHSVETMTFRLLPLLLLVCGLSSTPLFSLEQSPDATVTVSSVPQPGNRDQARVRTGAGEPGVGTAGTHTSGAGISAPLWKLERRPVAHAPPLTAPGPIHPGIGRTTYQANAPPAAPLPRS